MVAWREVSAQLQCRTWTSIPGPTWCYDPTTGDITAGSLHTTPSDGELALAAAKVPDQLALLRQAGAEPFYARALLAIGLHESHFDLPSYGDCRIGNKVVTCGTPGADAPRSVGYYQFLRGTAANVGVTWDSLATDPMANHRAGLKLAHSTAAIHGEDFPTLVTLWNSGSVRPDPSNQWGVHMWASDTVTQFVRYWNAVGPAMKQIPNDPGKKGQGSFLTAVVTAAIVVAGGLLLKSRAHLESLKWPPIPSFS